MDAGWTKWLPRAVHRNLEGRHYLQTVLGNSGWLLSDKLVRLVVGLTVAAIVARYLGPGQFGQLNYAIAFVALFSAVANFGLDNIVIRDFVRNPADKNSIMGSAFALKLIGAIVAMALALVTVVLLRPSDRVSHELVAILSVGTIFQAFDVIDFFLQSTMQSKYTVFARVFAFVIFAGIRLLLVYSHVSLVAFAWSASGELALAAAGLVIIARKTSTNISFSLGKLRHIRSLLTESWPFFVSGLAIMLYMRIDQIMLASVKGVKEVGIYSAALRLSEIWYVLPTVIVSSVAPSLTTLHVQSTAHYYERIQKLLTILTGTAYLVALPMTLLSTALVTFAFGSQYAAAGPILGVHIWTAVFVNLGVASGPWVVNEGLGKLQLYRTVVGASTNVALNLFLIPEYGGIGAAVATLVSQSVAAYLSFALLKKTRVMFGMMTKALCLRT